MTLAEEILYKRELLVFIGVENHSTPYHPRLFSQIWDIPKEIPSKDVLIIPVQGLEERFKLSKKKEQCYGRLLWLLFVRSTFLTHNAILFDSFAQVDDNTYYSKNNLSFLQKSNCRTVSICDMGVYKSRSLVNLLNSSISSLACLNITVNLITILGYNSRGATDIEKGDENLTYTKMFYLQSDIETKVLDDSFQFMRIDCWFNLRDLYRISCLIKNPAESKLQEIKKNAVVFERILKPLCDVGFFKSFIQTLDKGDAFDFNSLENKLLGIGFKGDLIDSKWPLIYDKLCRNIRNSNKNTRGDSIQKLISTIEDNIIATLKYIELI